MIKRIALIALVGFVMISCGQVKEQQSDAVETQLISELVSSPLEYEGKEVSFDGVISHICRHSGDKMRVNQVDDTDFSIMVMLEEFKPQFSAEFEGKHVKVTGLVKTVVRNMEELEHSHEHEHEHDGEEGHGCSSTEEAVKLMAERGITPDIRAFVELRGFEIVEDEVEAEEEVLEVAEATETGAGY